MANDVKTLSEELSELMDAQNVSAEKLANLTDIPLRFIAAMTSGELDKLPGEPYIRGYLIKIGPLLKIEPEKLLNSYRESLKTRKVSNDKLPGNRFAKVGLRKSQILGIATALLIVLLIVFRFKSIFGIPEIDINIPEISTTESIKITGSVRPGDRVTLNEEAVYVNEAGSFEKTINLSEGLNPLKFKVKRFLGRESELTKQVYYETSPGAENKSGTAAQ